MKVVTDLRAGGLIQSAAQQVGQATNKTLYFLDKADQQARNLTKSAVNAASSVYNTLLG